MCALLITELIIRRYNVFFEWILGGIYDAILLSPSWSCSGFCILFLFAPTAFAAEQTVEAPSVDARAWILMDYASGKVLAEGNADEKLIPRA